MIIDGFFYLYGLRKTELTYSKNYDECHQYKQGIGENGEVKVDHSINTTFTAPRHEEADTKIVYTVCKLELPIDESDLSKKK